MNIQETQAVRVNSRIGIVENEWLNAESKRTGISKSSLIQMAVEAYIIDRHENRAFINRIAEQMKEKK